MQLIPKKEKWRRWTWPTKFAVVGVYLTILSLIVSAIAIVIPFKCTPDSGLGKRIDKIERSLEAMNAKLGPVDQYEAGASPPLKIPRDGEKCDNIAKEIEEANRARWRALSDAALNSGIKEIENRNPERALVHLVYALDAADEDMQLRSGIMYYRSIAELYLDSVAAALKSIEAASQAKPSEDVLTMRAYILARLMRFHEALLAVEQVLAGCSGDHIAWNCRGLIMLGLNNYGEAVSSFRKSVQLAPSYAPALTNLGSVFREFGELDSAEAYLSKSSRIDSTIRCTWYNLGLLYVNLRKYQAAVNAYDRALEIDDTFCEAWYNRGIVLLAVGDTSAAAKSYDSAISCNPRFKEAILNRGNIDYERGKYQNALESYYHALEIDSTFCDTWYSVGLALLQLGRNEESAHNFERSLDLCHDDPVTWYRYSIALIRMKKGAIAQAALDSANYYLKLTR